jgi:hypothetical protein
MARDFCTWLGSAGSPCHSTLPEPDVEIRLHSAPVGASGVVAHVMGEGHDGLLAGVMRRFEESSLRLREFSIRTIRDEVDDGSGSSRSSPTERREIETR